MSVSLECRISGSVGSSRECLDLGVSVLGSGLYLGVSVSRSACLSGCLYLVVLYLGSVCISGVPVSGVSCISECLFSGVVCYLGVPVSRECLLPNPREKTIVFFKIHPFKKFSGLFFFFFFFFPFKFD